MKSRILIALAAFLFVSLAVSAWASSCSCGSGTVGDGISCSNGCGCVSAGSHCACFCSHPKQAPPISFNSKDLSREVAAQPASPLARALAKANSECIARLKEPTVVEVKDLSADVVDTLLRALCERALSDTPKK
jgi:hypothetical protein